MSDRSVFCTPLPLPGTQGRRSPKKLEVPPRDSALLHPFPRRRRRFLVQEPCADELTKPSARLISMCDRTVFHAPLPLPDTQGGSSPKKTEVTPRDSPLRHPDTRQLSVPDSAVGQRPSAASAPPAARIYGNTDIRGVLCILYYTYKYIYCKYIVFCIVIPCLQEHPPKRGGGAFGRATTAA